MRRSRRVWLEIQTKQKKRGFRLHPSSKLPIPIRATPAASRWPNFDGKALMFLRFIGWSVEHKPQGNIHTSRGTPVYPGKLVVFLSVSLYNHPKPTKTSRVFRKKKSPRLRRGLCRGRWGRRWRSTWQKHWCEAPDVPSLQQSWKLTGELWKTIFLLGNPFVHFQVLPGFETRF